MLDILLYLNFLCISELGGCQSEKFRCSGIEPVCPDWENPLGPSATETVLFYSWWCSNRNRKNSNLLHFWISFTSEKKLFHTNFPCEEKVSHFKEFLWEWSISDKGKDKKKWGGGYLQASVGFRSLVISTSLGFSLFLPTFSYPSEKKVGRTVFFSYERGRIQANIGGRFSNFLEFTENFVLD